MRRLALAVSLAVLSAAPLAAQGGRSPSADRCQDARTQTELNTCAAREYRAADAELNRVWQRLMTAADAEQRPLLRTAQRAWVAFRDAHCASEAADFRGGSIEPMLRSLCLADVTRARTAQLAARITAIGER